MNLWSKIFKIPKVFSWKQQCKLKFLDLDARREQSLPKGLDFKFLSEMENLSGMHHLENSICLPETFYIAIH